MNTNKAVRNLVPGDTLAGSGFVVVQAPYRGLQTPKRKVWLAGHYGDENNVVVREWNPSTIVQVVN